MDEQKQKLIERIAGAQNILVTVSSNPSVDQLSAAIGLTLVLNKMDKHGTAVFSGTVPSTLEFLKPEETLEKNTDSLRDFIIALDKSKADKLRYKVEDEVVRIFITPYKTSLSEKDLQFSQGDFNVDVVVCLGVTEQQDLDTAITAHGRILHDATVVSISTTGQGSLGSINWVDPAASSLSEMMVSLADSLDKKAMNNQVATALLTGIVASTERFRNDKTTPKTMSAAAALMAAGANQQLIATELEAPVAVVQSDSGQSGEGSDSNGGVNGPPPEAAPAKKTEPGTLEISHHVEESAAEPEPEPEPEHPQIHVDEDGKLLIGDNPPTPTIGHVRGVGASGEITDSDTDHGSQPAVKTEVHRELMTKMPELGTPNITANTEPESYDLPTEELTLPALDSPLLSHNESVLSSPASMPSLPPLPPPPSAAPAPLPPPPAPVQPDLAFTPPAFEPMSQPPLLPTSSLPSLPPLPPVPVPVDDDKTLAEIEQAVDSPHVRDGDAGVPTSAAADPTDQIDDARSAVAAAYSSGAAAGNPLEPIAALNAQQLGPDIRHTAPAAGPAPDPYVPPANLFSPAAQDLAPPPAPAAQTVPNMGFSEPTPGNSPADETLDMPLPGGSFGQTSQPLGGQPAPGQQAPGMSIGTAPGVFPGAPGQGGMSMGGQTPPPPVPPPMVPPLP